LQLQWYPAWSPLEPKHLSLQWLTREGKILICGAGSGLRRLRLHKSSESKIAEKSALTR
jgi:hypothetical protein